jgi:hypothetical protein
LLLASCTFARVKFCFNFVARAAGVLFAFAFVHAVAGPDADNQPAPAASGTTNAAGLTDTRYGLFDGLDHRSAYTLEVFPEPFLVDDMALEDNEIQLTWLHTKGSGQQSDVGSIEFQKGIGLMTLELLVPFERDVSPEQTARGIGNIDLSARYPLYQYVSADRMVDATFGASMEGGIPVQMRVSRNAELLPQIFNDLKLGDHLTVQSVMGYSTLLGGGDEGGLRSFEYGFSFGYAIEHRNLPLPGVQQFTPMFEVAGETELNKEDPGENNLLGDVGFRAKLNHPGEAQPSLGFSWIFPLDIAGRAELHWGVVVSLIFDF